jgi:hypothetical protein
VKKEAVEMRKEGIMTDDVKRNKLHKIQQDFEDFYPLG